VNTSVSAVQQVSVHAAWPVLSALCGVLIALAGVLIAWRGARWAAMSAKYDAPARPADEPDGQAARARTNASLWRELDHGNDPTQSPPGP
jgi:uncharacterized membrane protein (TIGR02234 family)